MPRCSTSGHWFRRVWIQGMAMIVMIGVGSILPMQAVASMVEGSPADTLSQAAEQAQLLMEHSYLEPVEYERDNGTPSRARELAEHLRLEFIEELDALGLADPSSDYVVGHRVGMRVKAGLEDEALDVAQECGASAWWCAELTGFALHVKGEFAAADSAFRIALDRMPTGVRCGERGVGNIATMLTGSTARAYGRLDCAEREALEARFWWLADPLHLTEANERHLEHRARLVGLRLHHQQYLLTDPAGWGCGDRHWNGVVRHGWPPRLWSHFAPWVTGSDLPGQAFSPSMDAMEDPLGVDPGDWDLDPGGVGERYDLPYGSMREMEHQVGFFLRGDSAVVVAATEGVADRASTESVRQVGVVLSRNPEDPPVIERVRSGSAPYRFRMTAPADRHLVSVELLTDSGAARARFGGGLSEYGANGLGLSNLLFFDWSETQAEELDSIEPYVLGTTRLTMEDTVGVYWEVYGVNEDDTLGISLRVVDESPGFLRRLGQTLRLVGPAEGVTLSWDAQSGPDEDVHLGTSLQFGLEGLDPADYRLELTVERDGEAVTEVRRFSVGS